MSNEVQTEVERLVAIARSHALYALARPQPLQDAYLANCRRAWKHYAAAFNSSESGCDDFADSLERATRNLMTEIRKNIAVIVESGNFPIAGDSTQSAELNGLTLEELRPMFRRIVEGPH